MGRRLKLSEFFALTMLVLAGLLAAVFGLLSVGGQHAIERAGESMRAAAANKVARVIENALMEGDKAIDDFEGHLLTGLANPKEPNSIVATLQTVLLSHPRLTELTLTFAHTTGFDANDTALLTNEGKGQASAFREPDGRIRTLSLDGTSAAWNKADPTAHPTFTTPTQKNFTGRVLWSDLAYTQLDAALPEQQRRKTLTVQKALPLDSKGLLGVLRAGVLSDTIDEIGRQRVNESDRQDPHTVFLCDTAGRLISKASASDVVTTLDGAGNPDPDGDLRVRPRDLSAPVAAALATTDLTTIKEDAPLVHRFSLRGVRYIATFTALAPDRTRDWLVGIVVPEAYYLGDLARARRQTLMLAVLCVGLIFVGGLSAMRAVTRGFANITEETDRLRRLDLAPTVMTTRRRFSFDDVLRAQDSLQLAKTAIRTMGKYVPVDLIRQLYREGREPTMGGTAQDLSIMFTDIEGFTTQAEQLPPDQLAHALGLYLGAMTDAIAQTGGTVDKYIGDAVMVLWNAPTPQEGHARQACHAALACVNATQALFASTKWPAIPAWRTRFGLHTGRMLVGHFGSPHRISYTAIGDGVNLTARLEGLNKAYGTQILVSAALARAAGTEFVFRHIDRVAVKGKHQSIDVFELVGREADGSVPPARRATVRRYETALQAYFARDFSHALDLLGLDQTDRPTIELRERCHEFTANPPAEDWDGSYHPEGK